MAVKPPRARPSPAQQRAAVKEVYKALCFVSDQTAGCSKPRAPQERKASCVPNSYPTKGSASRWPQVDKWLASVKGAGTGGPPRQLHSVIAKQKAQLQQQPEGEQVTGEQRATTSAAAAEPSGAVCQPQHTWCLPAVRPLPRHDTTAHSTRDSRLTLVSGQRKPDPAPRHTTGSVQFEQERAVVLLRAVPAAHCHGGAPAVNHLSTAPGRPAPQRALAVAFPVPLGIIIPTLEVVAHRLQQGPCSGAGCGAMALAPAMGRQRRDRRGHGLAGLEGPAAGRHVHRQRGRRARRAAVLACGTGQHGAAQPTG